MQRASTIAVLDFAEIPAGVAATDAMLKRAPVSFVRSGSVTRGRFLTVLGGSTAAVQEALRAGLEVGGTAILDHVLLADVHPLLLDGILGGRHPASGPLALLETDTAAAAVRAAERALKGAMVELVEVRLADAGLSGKGLVVLCGALHDLDAAVELATSELSAGGLRLRTRVIPAPHPATVDQTSRTTRFDDSELLDLGGEVG
ncbi:MAG TPA: BMC domain-containing protein [Thermoanaerobaculaceae bacterium]|nr:BMC domain-containing protein [Thermoanaerobaculaceae bacterium]